MSCQLLLPRTIYAVPGRETNLYFRNVALDPVADFYLFDIHCDFGVQESRRWTWTPKEDHTGDHLLKIEVRNLEDQVVATGETTIHVSKVDAGSDKSIKLLCIGDSLTNASIYTEELFQLGSDDKNPKMLLLGTNGPTEKITNRHEGYGGWTFKSFLEKWNPEALPDAPPNSKSSPFLFLENEKPILNLSRYFKEKLNGEYPDYVTIMLGINDVFLANNTTRDEMISSILKSAQELVAALRSALPHVSIGLIPPVPPSTSQDAFGASYGSGQSRWTYRKNQHALVARLMETFGNRESENLFLVPAYTNLDCDYGFPTQKSSVSARNPHPQERPSNGVHPARSGYLQIADSIFAWIKSLEENRK